MRKIALALALLPCVAHAQQTQPSISRNQASKIPSYASSLAGTMYASTCNVVVNTATPVSTFCPVATDSTSATKRTYPAGSLVIGKAFRLEGGGMYSVPLSNTNTASIAIKVGSSSVINLTTPVAPVGNNQGVTFIALCSVRTSTTIACNGRFSFNVSGTGLSADAPFDASGTFTPGVDNVIDVTGNWNGTITSHSTTVTQAVLTALN